jgi:hypothetical protein
MTSKTEKQADEQFPEGGSSGAKSRRKRAAKAAPTADQGLNSAVSAAEAAGGPAGDTTLDRAESLPEEALPAPDPTPSQEALSLDDELASAVAPEDEDVELSEEDLGPPQYTSIPRRTSPPRMVPIRIFPKSAGSMTIYMLAVNRDAQSDGDQDTYPLAQSIRVKLIGHPVFQKGIRRFQIRLGVTSLGRPFFLEVNLDDQGIWGQTRRDLAAIAENQWILVSSDRSTGYSHHPSDHEGDPVQPAQSFTELYLLTYKPIILNSLAHPVIKRGYAKPRLRPTSREQNGRHPRRPRVAAGVGGRHRIQASCRRPTGSALPLRDRSH